MASSTPAPTPEGSVPQTQELPWWWDGWRGIRAEVLLRDPAGCARPGPPPLPEKLSRTRPGAREDPGCRGPPNPHTPSLSPPRSLLPNNGVGRTAPILQAKSPDATRVARMESWEAAGKQGPLPISGGATSPHRCPTPT